jgi:hypothetical protein
MDTCKCRCGAVINYTGKKSVGCQRCGSMGTLKRISRGHYSSERMVFD